MKGSNIEVEFLEKNKYKIRRAFVKYNSNLMKFCFFLYIPKNVAIEKTSIYIWLRFVNY